MDQNISNKLTQILSGLNSGKLKGSAGIISSFLNSPEGQRLKNSLSENDKKDILEKFMRSDTNEIKQKLNNVDLGNLKNLSTDEILKKLR